MNSYLVLDFETFSRADLKKVGAWEYSKDPSTKVLCTGWTLSKNRFGPDVNPIMCKAGFPEVIERWIGQSDRNILVAHNAGFERYILWNVLGIEVPIERWICTAALSRMHGLPGRLDHATEALKLEHRKDMEGHRVMLRMTKPGRPQKDGDLERLIEYCKADVAAEVEIFHTLKLPHPLMRDFWIQDQVMNERGFAVDRELARHAIEYSKQYKVKQDRALNKLTHGRITTANQRQALLSWINEHGEGGSQLPNMQAKTIQDALGSWPLSDPQRTALTIRSNLSRSSTAKYNGFFIRSNFDGRARDNTIPFGAHTGRQAGTGVQAQNIFKSVLPHDEVELATDLIRDKNFSTLEMFWDKPMDVLASTLRGCIISEPGKSFFVGDFSTIEVRVLFWLAQHTLGLDAIRSGRDLYIDMAGEIFGVKPDLIQKAYDAKDKKAFQQRQLGKQTVLGAGYGIGINGKKFQATCAQYGIEVSLELAIRSIKAYRKKHHRIPAFWTWLEGCAVSAIAKPGKFFGNRLIKWIRKDDWLYAILPSGRPMIYPFPELKRKKTFYGTQMEMSYMGVDPKIKKFVRMSTWGGKLTENIVQAVSADLLLTALCSIERDNTFKPVLAVHDEIVCEGDPDNNLKYFEILMSTVPHWAQGLPVGVECWKGDRYKK